MSNFFGFLIDTWRDRATLGDGARPKTLSEFMPAALEIQETPPHPITRWLSWSLISLFSIGLLWACVGKIDVVASAEGKIIPSGRVKQIQPLSKGIVKAIHVKEGQYVNQGDPLIELDRTLTAADQARMQQELHNSILNMAGAKSLQKLLVNSHSSPKSADAIELELGDKLHPAKDELILHKQKIWEQWQQYQAQEGGLLSNLTRVKSEKIANHETVKKLQQTLPLITKRAQALESLYKKNMASETEYLLVEQQRIERVQDLAVQIQQQQQLEATIEEAEQQVRALRADTHGKLLTQIAEDRNRIATLNEELIKAIDVNAKQILYAPVSGYIQQLSANTVGGVVTEAQQLMIIVPEEESLEIQVMLRNQDIGFVQKGMQAEIKVHTFPFTKYGLINATVTQISEDAILDENLGLVYSMQLIMHKSALAVEGRLVKLIPGMAVTAEVKTDQRRVIEYFLSPLQRVQQESIRER